MALYDPGKDDAPLALMALPVVGDVPPIPELQPVLPNGIHLRWAFDPNKGFPWWGFYLFRRPTLTTGAVTCAASQFGGFTPGPLPSPDLPIPLGTFHSDQNLVLTDDFPTGGTVEIDLSARSFVSFKMDQSLPNRHVDVTIGFVENFPPPDGTPGPGGSPGTGGGLGSGAPQRGICGCGCDHAAIGPLVDSVVALGGGQYRATFGYGNEGSATSMPIGPENRFFPDPSDRGQPTLLAGGQHNNAFSVVFDGQPLSWRLAGSTVTVSAADVGSGGGTGGGGSDGAGIVVNALRQGVVVATRVVSGSAGQLVTVKLDFEAIDEIQLTPGPARLVDICVIRNTDGRGQGWAPVPGLTQPVALPVKGPKYPISTGTPDVSASQALALARITYAFPLQGAPQGTLDTIEWAGQNFSELHAMLSAMVASGPPAFMDQVIPVVTADPDPDDPNEFRPTWTNQSALAIVLAASANPAMAQMLGLYLVDGATTPGQSYDYLLVGDYRNAANGNLNTIQALVNAQNYTNIDAYERLGVVLATTPPLAPPDSDSLQAYALPLSSVPVSAPADSAGLIGVRWGIAKASEQTTKIAPTESFLFHVWRKDFGRAGPGAAETFDPPSFSRQTVFPVAPGKPRVEDPPPTSLAGWPSGSLFQLDGPLIEGWYAYRVNGIDLFGRYSDRSALVPWLDPDGTLEDARAVHIIDTTPPPPPSAMQAWLLDPDDTFVLQDTAYATWRQANTGKIGLRVRWAWGPQQRRQAPDAREFRIYLNAGSELEEATVPTNWNQRIAIVGMGEQIVPQSLLPLQTPPPNPQNIIGQSVSVSGAQVTLLDGPSLEGIRPGEAELQLGVNSIGHQFAVVDVDVANRVVTIDQSVQQIGTITSWALLPLRTYELFLPGTALATPAVFTPPPVPPRDAPVAYSLVGVSCADDKDRDDLRPTPQPLTPRLGNEGSVGGPSMVVQILRKPPDPPAAPFDEASLLATRADFLSRSFFTLHAVKQPQGQPALAVHVYRALDETLFQVDGAKGFPSPQRISEANALNRAALGPTWTIGRLGAAVSQLTALASATGYAGLTNDARRVLASLPSNAAAFSCITRAPLPATAGDERGLSDPPGYNPQARNDLVAFTDILDGRASNRYFYRTTLVDAAQNQSPLGVATPPVELPIVTLPPAPVLLDAGAGSLSVRLSWQSSPDPTVTEYRVHRAPSEAALLRMSPSDVVLVVPETQAPGQRPASITKDTIPSPAGTVLFYAVTAAAVPAAPGFPRESEPSRIVPLTAYDDSRPVPPAWSAPQPQAGGLLLRWTTQDATLLRFLVQRSTAAAPDWIALSPWLAGDVRQYLDNTRAAATQYSYRLLVLDNRGRQNSDFNVVTA